MKCPLYDLCKGRTYKCSNLFGWLPHIKMLEYAIECWESYVQ